MYEGRDRSQEYEMFPSGVLNNTGPSLFPKITEPVRRTFNPNYGENSGEQIVIFLYKY